MSTTTWGWRASGVAAAAASLVIVRLASVLPLGDAGDSAATQLRLSFSARPERIERCTELSDAELAKLPAHMRLRTKCEGVSARYVLTIVVGNRMLAADTLRGGGLRHDRPLHVFREHVLSPGMQRLQIEVARIDEGVSSGQQAGEREEDRERTEASDTLLGGRAEREREERARRTAEAMPARLVLDTVMTIPSQRVVLVTFDNDARRLVARMEP